MSIPLAIKEFRVRSLDIDYNELSWKLVDTSEDVFDYTFQVLRSESPSGPFDELTTPFQDRYLVIDNTLQTGNRWRKYFYKIRISRLADTTDCADTEAVTKDPDPDLIALELRRHHQLLFQEFAGRRCWVLSGAHVSAALPVVAGIRQLRQRTRSGCKVCYMTPASERGYLHPIEQWLQIDPSPKTKQVMNVGDLAAVEHHDAYGVVSAAEARRPRHRGGEPSLSEGHHGVADGEGPRNAAPGDLAAARGAAEGHRVHHRARSQKAALRDLWISPSRNFSNPMNLEAVDDTAPDFLDMYTRRR